MLSIPYFPREFYEQKLAGPGAKWGPQVGEYDFLAPEEALAEFAVAHGFEFVRGGALLREAGLSLAEIKPFYFAEGTGHLTEAGHAFFARGLAAAIRAKAAAPGDK